MVVAAPEIILFTIAEAAEFLRLSEASVYRRCESGELRAIRLGGGLRAPIRIAAEELERYLRDGAATEHDRARPSTKADGAR